MSEEIVRLMLVEFWQDVLEQRVVCFDGSGKHYECLRAAGQRCWQKHLISPPATWAGRPFHCECNTLHTEDKKTAERANGNRATVSSFSFLTLKAE